RQALGTQSVPPNQIIIGLSLLLTFFVMGPTFERVYQEAYLPYTNDSISFEQALDKAEAPMRSFMLKQTRQSDFGLFARLARLDPQVSAQTAPLRVLVPAFVTSELKSAFQIGFMIFIPFLVIDMLVSSILMSLGMMMPSTAASTGMEIISSKLRASRPMVSTICAVIASPFRSRNWPPASRAANSSHRRARTASV
ncbi:flagellar biosynthetic protein FliP, partial [Verminephrobacter sp. Larva24]